MRLCVSAVKKKKWLAKKKKKAKRSFPTNNEKHCCLVGRLHSKDRRERETLRTARPISLCGHAHRTRETLPLFSFFWLLQIRTIVIKDEVTDRQWRSVCIKSQEKKNWKAILIEHITYVYIKGYNKKPVKKKRKPICAGCHSQLLRVEERISSGSNERTWKNVWQKLIRSLALEKEKTSC